MHRKYSKKLIICTLILSMLLAFTACGKDEETQITSLAELSGHSVSVAMGTMHASAVQANKNLENVDLQYYMNNVDAVSQLLNGKTDAFITDYTLAKAMVNNYDGLVILNELLESDPYGAIFPKGSSLKAEFDAVISAMKSDGRLKALETKWLEDDGEKALSPIDDSYKAVLHCLSNPDAEPFCYLDANGNLTGFDIDLARQIGNELGYKIEFTQAEFDDLIPAISSKLADFAISSITYTAERAERVDYSEPYFDCGIAALVRDVSAAGGTETIGSISDTFYKTFIENGRWKEFVRGLGVTLSTIVLSVAFGLALGFGIFLWVYSGSTFAKKFFGIINAFYGYIPVSIWLFIFYYIVFGSVNISSYWIAIVAFSIGFGLGVYSTLNGAVSSLHYGQVEAAISMGYNKYKALYKVYLPQAMPAFLGGMQGACVGMVKISALVEFIAGRDLQAVADAVRAETMEPVLTIVVPAIIYLLLCIAVDKGVAKLKQKYMESNKTEEEIMAKLLRG